MPVRACECVVPVRACECVVPVRACECVVPVRVCECVVPVRVCECVELCCTTHIEHGSSCGAVYKTASATYRPQYISRSMLWCVGRVALICSGMAISCDRYVIAFTCTMDVAYKCDVELCMYDVDFRKSDVGLCKVQRWTL